MKDFDGPRALRRAADREFTIGGQTFIRRASVRPESLAAYDELDATNTSVARTLEIVDGLIVAFIEPVDDAHERWRMLREQDVDPIDISDMQLLAEWLMENATGRPTSQPGASSTGPGRTGTPSTGVSSSPAIQAA